MQDMGVRCACCRYLTLHPKSDLFLFLSRFFVKIAEAYANDPKNPYAAQVAKEKEAHH